MATQDFAHAEIKPNYDIGKIVELTELEDPGQVFTAGNMLYVQNATSQQLKQAVTKYEELHQSLTFDKAKQNALTVIERYAGNLRKMLITESFGQELVYQEKYDEAIKYLTQDQPDHNSFPFLRKESQILDITLQTLAERILHARSLWVKHASTIEQFRIKYRHQLNDSHDKNQVTTIESHAYMEFNTIKEQIEQDLLNNN